MDTQTIIEEVKGTLGNLAFPARKEDVVNHAKEQGASPQAQQTLEQLPEQKFDSIGDLLGKLPVVGNLEGEVERFL